MSEESENDTQSELAAWEMLRDCRKRLAETILQLAESKLILESSKRARKSLSDACDLLQRQLDETSKQLLWKQHRVEVLQRVGRKIVVERDEVLDALAKQLNYANDMREQRDQLANAIRLFMTEFENGNSMVESIADTLFDSLKVLQGGRK